MKINKFFILFFSIAIFFFCFDVNAAILDDSKTFLLDYENIDFSKFTNIGNKDRLTFLGYVTDYLNENVNNNYFLIVNSASNVTLYGSNSPIKYSYYYDSSRIFQSYILNDSYYSLNLPSGYSSEVVNARLNTFIDVLNNNNFSNTGGKIFNSGFTNLGLEISLYDSFLYYSNTSVEFVDNSSTTLNYSNFLYNNKIISINNPIPTYNDYLNYVPPTNNSFSNFLNLLGKVCSMFLNYFLLFCNYLVNNWFILVLLGFSLAVSVIWLAFDLVDLSYFGIRQAKRSVDDYLDKKADKELAIRLQAEKELIMRQNYQYDLQKSIEKYSVKELIMRQNYQYYLQKSIEKDSFKELINRQNRTQIFDPDTNSIVNIPDINFVSNLKYRNFKNYSYGKLDNFILKKSNIPDLPIWFDKKIDSVPVTAEEKNELDNMIKEMSNDV